MKQMSGRRNGSIFYYFISPVKGQMLRDDGRAKKFQDAVNEFGGDEDKALNKIKKRDTWRNIKFINSKALI